MAVQTILKRVFHGVVLLLIGVVAYFQARGVAELLSAALISRADRKSTLTDHDRETNAPSPAPKSADAILARNPFDSMTSPLRPSSAAATPQALDTFADPLAWPTCEDIQASIVTESRDPWWSLATLHARGEPQAHLRRVGDHIAGKQVTFIGYNPRQQAPSVWLTADGQYCQSSLFGVPTPPATTIPLPPTTPPPNHVAALSRLRVVPEQKDGKVVGLRLFGVGTGSLLGSLGLRNGDRLESINGFPLTNAEQGLVAYAQLRTASHLHLRLSRVGKPLEIDLNII